MERKGFKHISQFKGKLNAKDVEGINMFETISIKFELKENCGLKKSGEQTVKLVHHSLLSSYLSEKYFKNLFFTGI